MFLHDSLSSKKFVNDKKLNLLKKGVITFAQFINLIDKNDSYMIFGPAIIDKEKINEFMNEWRQYQLIESAKSIDANRQLSMDDIIEKFDDLKIIFPEIEDTVSSYREMIKHSACPKCTKNHYITEIVSIIKKVKDRDFGELDDFIKKMLNKYSNHFENSDIKNFNDLDVEWIKPESIAGLGYDLIDKLESCLECAVKHIGRAKILYEEFLQGYPEHEEISIIELNKGGKDLEQYYIKYLDSCAQLDMGSSEMVGNIVNLDKNIAIEILDLANEIRQARILFQDDINMPPDFDGLRIKIKKLELKINSNK